MKKLIKNKHWYTQNLDYSVDGNVYGYDKFWLNENDELIVRIARVYAVDEDAFTEYHNKKINEIINEMKVGTDLPRLCFIYRDNGKIKLEWSFEPTGIQIDGQLKLDEFEQWEASWHKLLEETEFPYKYEDDPNFSY